MPVPVPEYDPVVPFWFAPLLSLISLLISAATFGWSLYRDLMNRPKVRVNIGVRKIVVTPDGRAYSVAPNLAVDDALEGLYIVLSMANLRERPVRWIGWGGKYKQPMNGKTGFVIVPDGLPRTLNDGEDFAQHARVSEASLNIKRIWAWDSTGRDWKPSWWATRKMRKEIRAALPVKGPADGAN